jgi:SPP1 gp7 family putative phage head morphogenesis protein
MHDLILQSLRESVKQHPELLPHLKGYARWAGEVYAWKRGEAPDDEQRRKDERRLAKRFVEFFDGQLARILKALKDEYKTLQPGFWDDEDADMWDEMADDFVGILVHGVDGGLGVMPGGTANLVDRDAINTALIAYAKKYRNEWLFKINRSTRDYVEQAVSNWLLSGDPLKELVRSLSNPDVGMFTKMRAERIAVTEVTRLFAQANKIAFEESGVVDEFIWMTVEDGDVCTVCDGHRDHRYPLADMDSMIPEHVNCRCWGQPVVNMDKIEQQFEDINNGL